MAYQQDLIFFNIFNPSTHNTWLRNNAMGRALMGFASAPLTIGVTVMFTRHTVFVGGRCILGHPTISSMSAGLT